MNIYEYAKKLICIFLLTQNKGSWHALIWNIDCLSALIIGSDLINLLCEPTLFIITKGCNGTKDFSNTNLDLSLKFITMYSADPKGEFAL